MVTETTQHAQSVPAMPNLPEGLKHFFPLVPGTKEPIKDMHWRVVAPGQYQPIGSYGIALQGDCMVIDADPRNYPAGRDCLAELLNLYPELKNTFWVSTPSGGYHLYLKKPTDVELKKHQDNYPGIDFLSYGHYVVGPGTELSPGPNRSAGVYRAENVIKLAEASEAFLAHLEKKGAAITGPSGEKSLSMEAQFKSLCEIEKPASKGNRGISTYKLACQARDMGLPQDTAFEHIRDSWNPRNLPPEVDSELSKSVTNAYNYARNSFGVENVDNKFAAAAPPIPVYMETGSQQAADKKALSDLYLAVTECSVSYPYKVTADGVCLQRDEDKPGELFCGILTVAAITKGVGGDSSGGLALIFKSLDGSINKMTIPRTRLHDDARLLAQDLAARNFSIKPGKEALVLSYLFACRPKREVFAVAHTGWVPQHAELSKMVFVFPYGATDSNYCYQPERASDADSCKASGTLDDWVTQVFEPVRQNPYCLYEILKSLAACLLKYSPTQCGENLHGATTRGKTTLMQIGASVWGCGADPAAEPKASYIHTWNTTSNALEGLLARHNDLPVYFDELGTFSGTGFSELVYTIAGGAGKASMRQNRTMREPRSWRTLVTSTGEKTIREKIEELSFGRRANAKGGQMIRILDREVQANTFDNGEQVQKLKQACGKFYGNLGPAFVAKLIEQYTDSSLATILGSLIEASKNRLAAFGHVLNAAQNRVAQRYYLIESTGQLLVSFGLITGLAAADVCAAIDKIFTDWLPTSADLNDVNRAVKALREFYLTHRDSRFKTVSQISESISTANGDNEEPICSQAYRDSAGFVDRARQFVDFYPHAISEATGVNAKDVACELDKLGLLDKRAKRLTNKRRFEGREINVYRVKLAFLEDSDNASDATQGHATNGVAGTIAWRDLI